MKWLDYVILLAVAAAVIAAVFALVRQRRKRGCSGCASCPYARDCKTSSDKCQKDQNRK